MPIDLRFPARDGRLLAGIWSEIRDVLVGRLEAGGARAAIAGAEHVGTT